MMLLEAHLDSKGCASVTSVPKVFLSVSELLTGYKVFFFALMLWTKVMSSLQMR